MQLFKGRYVALMCLFFMLSFFIPSPYKIGLIIFFGVATIFSFVFFLKTKKKSEIVFAVIFICCISFFIGLLRSYFAIDFACKKALEYEGNQNIELTLISKGKSSDHSSEYTAIITKIEEKTMNIRALVLLPFTSELHSGDVIYARAELVSPNEQIWGLSAYERTYDEKILITAVIYSTENLSVLSCGNELSTIGKLVRKGGIEIVTNGAREKISTVFDDAFGLDLSPLAKGFFMNDTSDIPSDILRDFKRCSVSHIMAVSGMHITILLGAIDRLLTKLFVDKKIRCIIISVLSIFLLIITGFSSSASRAVIMLWISFLHFILADDEDSVTALFFAVFVILFISPYSCFDLGLWMSFLATLGLVTVYSFIDEKIPKKHIKKWYLRILKKTGLGILAITLMTVISNLFVLPISFSIFGEISLVSVPANIALATISTVFLCEIPIVFLLCKIPFLNEPLLALMRATANLILSISRYFSKWDHAIQPLNYIFADIIIPILVIVFVICLIIKIKYKWLMIIPPVTAIIAFGICLAITYAKQPAKAIYVVDGKEEMLVISENGRSVLCDISCSSVDMYYESYYLAKDCGANKIDTMILAHFSKEHSEIIERIGKFTIIDRLFLRQPINDKELFIARDIIETAESIGINVCIYNDEEIFETEQGITVYIDSEKEGKPALISVFKNSSALNFANPDITKKDDSLQRIMNAGRFAIISSSFERTDNENIVFEENNIELIVFGSEKAYNTAAFEHKDVPVYVNKEKYKCWNVAFPLN